MISIVAQHEFDHLNGILYYQRSVSSDKITLNKYHWETLKMNSTKIFALGGLNEIGKNTYCFEEGNEIIIVDAGVKFPDEELVSVRLIIPDYQSYQKIKTK